jgi:hypothetical protein
MRILLKIFRGAINSQMHDGMKAVKKWFAERALSTVPCPPCYILAP